MYNCYRCENVLSQLGVCISSSVLNRAVMVSEPTKPKEFIRRAVKIVNIFAQFLSELLISIIGAHSTPTYMSFGLGPFSPHN